ncbi:MAG: cupin domain-containing protein [Methylibium sp.]|nr:cupin domain-containing protein [Methylibium sp.]
MVMPADIDTPTPLLGRLSPRVFMRRHWQKKPLLIRQAMPGVQPPLDRRALFALASSEAVESRLIVRGGNEAPGGWRLRSGPLPRRALPPVSQPGWSLLVQGLDLHAPQARALLERFRFVPEARLDDLMLSWASDGGGVGPHVDSYDVFLLQVQGRRRWRVGAVRDATPEPGLPLKILARFEPQHEWLLEPGDMLYLPPGWGHDGVAEGECMTASIGFRAPERAELAREVLGRLLEGDDAGPRVVYRDASQPATEEPGRIPAALQAFAADAVARALREPRALQAALGEALTEPKPQVWFAPREVGSLEGGVVLDPRTRMMYDDAHVFVNGESWRAGGRAAKLMRRLADARRLTASELARADEAARELLMEWLEDGWLQALDGPAKE